MAYKGVENIAFINRVGEKFITKEGYNIEIFDYVNQSNCSVIFDNGFKKYNLKYSNVKRGIVSNPFHKLADGRCLGIDIRTLKGTDYKTSMITWISLINRCFRESGEAYKNVSPCADWLIFNNFYIWWLKNYNSETMQGWHLDKDILVEGSKIYSPETCAFVPRVINNLFIKRQNKSGCPVGVRKNRGRFVSTIGKGDLKVYLGSFGTLEEASQAYKNAKEACVKEAADEWKELIDPRIYKAMYEYKVEITETPSK